MRPVVQFEHVAKKFILHHQRSRTLQEAMVNFFRSEQGNKKEEFWSLRDVTFSVSAGETVGLIGQNGAGKSTILKLITRILQPTSGRIEINGRVGALLELGSGFHPDMTGRENIYLNGSILGLSQAEIRQKLDEIIAFAELERFIDLPVKHYSSGMYVRLGFAIAVHTEPDILLVDEVLAVGDAAFQRKCLERIDQLRQQGVTILLVSHSLNMMQQICKRIIWLNLGTIAADGTTKTIISQYTWHSYKTNLIATDNSAHRWGTGEICIEQIRLLDNNSQEQSVFRTNNSLTVEIHYRTSRRVENPIFGLAIHRSDGTHVTGPNTKLAGYTIRWLEGEGIIRYEVPTLSLLEGTYYLSVVVCNYDETCMYDYHDRLYPFRVTSELEQQGLIALQGKWYRSKPIDSDQIKVDPFYQVGG